MVQDRCAVSFACDRYLCMHGVRFVRNEVVIEVCRGVIFTLSLDWRSYPDDLARVYRVSCKCPWHVPFRNFVFA